MCYGGSLSIVKAEHSRVVCKEVDEAVDNGVIGACRRVIEVIFHDNVFLSLNFGFLIWAASGKVGEKPLSILSNRGMACGHACEAST